MSKTTTNNTKKNYVNEVMFWVPVSNCLGIKAPYKTNSVQIANAVQNTKTN